MVAYYSVKKFEAFEKSWDLFAYPEIPRRFDSVHLVECVTKTEKLESQKMRMS